MRARIEADFRDARSTLESGRRTARLGQVLVEQRQAQLEQAMETADTYTAKLDKLAVAEDKLLHTATAFDDFLVENLLWLRSAQPIGFETMMSLPGELRPLLSAPSTRKLPALAGKRLASGPLFWLGFAGAVVLLWRRRALITSIQSVADSAGKPTSDCFGLTVRVLVQAALVAAPPTLLLAVAFGALSWFLSRVFHPRRGVLAEMRAREPDRMLVRTYFLWYPVAVAFPLLMILMAFSGFIFAATSEAPLFRDTLLLVVALVLINGLALRWLQVARQRLAYEAQPWSAAARPRRPPRPLGWRGTSQSPARRWATRCSRNPRSTSAFPSPSGTSIWTAPAPFKE